MKEKKESGGYDKCKVKVTNNFAKAVKEKYPDLYERFGYFQLCTLVESIGDVIIAEILKNRDGIILPNNLGVVSVYGVPITRVDDPYKKKYMKFYKTGNFIFIVDWIKRCSNSKEMLKEFVFEPATKISQATYQAIVNNKFGHLYKGSKRQLLKMFYECFVETKKVYSKNPKKKFLYVSKSNSKQNKR